MSNRNKGVIVVGTSDIVDIIKDNYNKNAARLKTSQYINDPEYVTKSGKVYSVDTATNTKELTNPSGVSQGRYGATNNVTISNSGSNSIKIPYFSVNSQGLITSMVNRTLSVTTACEYCSKCDHTASCTNCSNCTNCSKCNYDSHCNCSP